MFKRKISPQKWLNSIKGLKLIYCSCLSFCVSLTSQFPCTHSLCRRAEDGRRKVGRPILILSEELSARIIFTIIHCSVKLSLSLSSTEPKSCHIIFCNLILLLTRNQLGDGENSQKNDSRIRRIQADFRRLVGFCVGCEDQIKELPVVRTN